MIWTSHPPKEDKQTTQSKPKHNQVNQDQAATLEKSIDIPLIVDRTETYEKEFLQKNKPKKQPVKPIIFALIAAVFVGSVLGAGVLKLLGLL